MRLLMPVILFVLAIIWALYSGIIKKDWKKFRDIIYPTLFFGGVWAVIYYFFFK